MWSNTCDQAAGCAQRSAANSNQIFGSSYGAAFADGSRNLDGYSGRATGVVLRRKSGPLGHDIYEVAIVFGADQAETPVHLSADDDTVIARWRRYARDLGLKLIIEAQDGTQAACYEQIGAVRLGEVHSRRRIAAMLKHRPRFLTRRRTGKLPARPVIRSEREISAPD